jgi:transcriptional regulator with XRE-family HTH domain
MGKPPVAITHREEIISKIAGGMSTKKIAEELGVTGSAISQYLSKDPEYQAAQLEFHANRLDTAEEMILKATDVFESAKARDTWKAYSWRASVEQKRIWGTQPETSSNGSGVTIIINRNQNDSSDEDNTITVEQE